MSGLPHGWNWTTLGEIADVVGGVTKDAKRQGEDGLVEVPYLRVANVQRGRLDLSIVSTIRVKPGKLQQLELQPGDVLLNEGGDRDKLGRGWVWQGQIPGCIHQNHVFRARIRDGILHPKLLAFYANEVAHDWFEQHGKQTTNLASISLSMIKKFPIPIPPQREQQRIVDILEDHLSRLDSATRTTDEMNRKLALLTEGLIENRLFIRQQYNPAHQMTSVGDIALVDSGPAFKSQLFKGPGEGIRLLRGDNIEPGSLRWSRTRTLPNELAEEYWSLNVAKDDIILAMDRPLVSAGLKIARVRQSDLPALLVQRVARIRPNDRVIGDYLYLLLSSRRFIRNLLGSQVGTQIPHITLRSIRDFSFPLPDLHVQQAVVSELSMMFDSCDRLGSEARSVTRRSSSLRRSLLTAAFAGTLTANIGEAGIHKELERD